MYIKALAFYVLVDYANACNQLSVFLYSSLTRQIKYAVVILAEIPDIWHADASSSVYTKM